ncbi:MAG: esterase/lipase, partial [Clostridiales bacterium]|nr:esterase/lipase [Clostridiales bacterium]
MGGLITLQLALNNSVTGIVTLNSPIYYWDLKRVLLNIVNDIKARKFDNIYKYFSSIYRLPARALFNFRMLLAKTKPILNLINCPIFIAQALQDDTVNKRSAGFIFKNIGSETKKIQYYNNSGHHILWSKVADSVMN